MAGRLLLGPPDAAIIVQDDLDDTYQRNLERQGAVGSVLGRVERGALVGERGS